MDSFHGMTAFVTVADVDLDGVERNDALIVLPFYARLPWRLMRWFPFLGAPLGRKAMADFRRLRTP